MTPRLLLPLLLLHAPLLMACGEHELAPLEEWAYRWEREPLQSQSGTPNLMVGQKDYQPFRTGLICRRLANPPNRKGAEVLWIRARLPKQGNPRDAVLYLGSIRFAGEIYLGQTPLYRYRELSPGHGRFRGHRWHMVSLPAGWQGKTLTFRLYSERPDNIGLGAVGVGSRAECIHTMVKSGIHFMALGLLFMLLGCFALATYFLVRKKRVYLAFGLVSLFTGLMSFFDNRVAQLFFPMNDILYAALRAAPYAGLIGICILFEAVYGEAITRITRRIGRGVLVVMVLDVVLALTQVLPGWTDPIIATVDSVVICVSMVVLVGLAVRRAFGGDGESKLFAVGFGFFGLLLLYEVSDLDTILGLPSDVYPWGMLVFLATMGLILELRFKNYATELEANNERLEQYNLSLEQKVCERTADLDDKNQELETVNKDLELLVAERTHQLVEQEKSAIIGRMIQGIAHNLKTPLAVVKSSGEVVAKRLQKVTESCEQELGEGGLKQLKAAGGDLDLLGKAHQQIVTILDALMLKSRMDHTEELTAVDVNELVRHELEFFRANTQFKHQVKKNLDLDPNVPRVTVVPVNLGQVLENLVSNALDAMWGQKDQSLGFVTRHDREHVYIEISDSGVGIPEDKLEAIFDPFFTSKPAKADAKEGEPAGTGLGLHTCLELLKPLGGELRVRSEPGRGSTFSVVLPKDREQGPS